jgi:hypothetical protein
MRNQNIRGGQDSRFKSSRRLTGKRVVNSEPRRVGPQPTRPELQWWREIGEQELYERREQRYERLCRRLECECYHELRSYRRTRYVERGMAGGYYEYL